MLSSRYDSAALFASSAHRLQKRKGSGAPYLSHLFRVSGLVLEYGATEDEAIAALLHDVVEDCGGMEALAVIRKRFGDFVADVVLETSDSVASDAKHKAPWRERKEKYVARLKTCSNSAALISGCDKLDNVSSFIRTIRTAKTEEERAAFLSKFKSGRSEQLWYFESVARALSERKIAVADELFDALERLKKIW